MRFTTVFLLTVNILCSLVLVLSVKYLFAYYDFVFSGTLTGIHFFFTWMVSVVLMVGSGENTTRISNEKEVGKSTVVITWKECLYYSALNMGSTWFMNLSLKFNSVGFYQIIKLGVIPCTVWLQWMLQRKLVERAVLGALLIITVGMAICTYTEIDFRWIGFLFGILAVFITSFSQMSFSNLMRERNINSTKLYATIGPMMTLFSLLVGFSGDVFALYQEATDEETHDDCLAKILPTIYHNILLSGAMTWIILSCCFAAILNFSTALILRNHGAIVLQVLGHVKTITTMVVGVWMFDKALTIYNLIGMFFTLAGVFLFSHYQNVPNATPNAATVSSSTNISQPSGDATTGVTIKIIK